MLLIADKKYQLVWACLVIILSLSFKWKTGSFFTISEKSHREVVAYEMAKRQGEITLSSLSESCADIFSLGAKLKANISSQPALSAKVGVIESTPEDSTVFRFIHKALDCSQYNETRYISEDEHITWVYHMENDLPLDSFGVAFQRYDDHFLITDILRINTFLLNVCN